MDSKINLIGLSRAELEQMALDMGEKAYRGRQIFKWIYKRLVFDFEQMTDIRAEVRRVLAQKYEISLPQIIEQRKSRDGTQKLLLELHDGHLIEAVLIFDDDSDRRTLCISSQAGCALGCHFCATGFLGLARNLSAGEIIAQVLLVREQFGDKDAFDNLVFMGMGEPLLNYEKVKTAIDILTDSLGPMLGAKRITVSTSGIVPGILKLAQSGSKVNLAISLNAPDDETRLKLMPVTKSYPLDEIMRAVKKWTKVHARRVTFEYILFKGINDREEDALKLAQLVRGVPCKINLLAYNPVAGAGFERPDEKDVERFAKILYPRTPAVTVRKSRGQDIEAACGQLAGKRRKS